MNIHHERYGALHGQDVYDRDGNRIGAIGHLWSAGAQGEADWASVRTGFFGLKETLIPLAGARPHAEGLQVPYTRDEIKEAPHVDADADEALHSGDLARLYQHYGLGTGTSYRGAHQDDDATPRPQVPPQADRARPRKHAI